MARDEARIIQYERRRLGIDPGGTGGGGRHISFGQFLRQRSSVRATPRRQVPLPPRSVPIAGGMGYGTRRGFRGKFVPNRLTFVQIDPRSIQACYELAEDFAEIPARANIAIDMAIRNIALIALGQAQKRSLGPVDPLMQNAAAAWQIPVRRITGAYFAGWRIERRGLGVWVMTNDSREAYYIEFGINHRGTGLTSSGGGANVRIRRPVMKLAVLETVKILRANGILVEELMNVIMPAGIYQSPMITGAYRPKGPSGSAIGLVDTEALSALAGGR